MKRKGEGLFRVLLSNLLVLLVGLVLAELFFGNWFGSRDPLSRLMIRRDFDLKYKLNGIYESNLDTIRYTRDHFGLRGLSTFNKPEEIDVLTVGGSTTDQKYIDDSRTWQEVLERRFREDGRTIHFSNSGIDGQATTAHIRNFEHWYSKIPGLKPRYILFYIGINDIYSAHMDYQDKLFLGRWTRFKGAIVNNSAFYDLYRKIRGTRAAMVVEVNHGRKRDSTLYEYSDSLILDPRESELYEQRYIPDFKTRVKKLIDLTLAMGAEPVFVTQTTARTKMVDGKVVGLNGTFTLSQSQYGMNGLGFYRLSNMYNDAIREVCGDRYKVVDLTKEPIFHSVDFYDWHHNSEVGAEKLGNELYRQLKEVLR